MVYIMKAANMFYISNEIVELTHSRICIFAAYSANNIIDEGVIYFNQMLFIKRCSVKWFNTFYLNRLLKNTEFPFYILPGKTLNKSALTSMLCKLYLIFEPVRLILKSSLYKELRRKCAPFKKMILERVKK